MSIYFNTGNHVIIRVMDSGKTIQLDDNSKWSISFLDKYRAMMWLSGDRVIVKPYIGSKFKIERVQRNRKTETVEAIFLN